MDPKRQASPASKAEPKRDRRLSALARGGDRPGPATGAGGDGIFRRPGAAGKEVLVTKDRGKFLPSRFAPYTTVTVHPSSILRVRADEERHKAMADFVEDLIKAAIRLKNP